jgi:internalin A
MIDQWRGRIRVRTQQGQAGELLQRLCDLVRAENARMGVRPVNAPQAERPLPPEPVAESGKETGSDPLSKLQISQERGSEPQWFVSYAWGDETPEGRERELLVDRLRAEAQRRGRVILRDKNIALNRSAVGKC